MSVDKFQEWLILNYNAKNTIRMYLVNVNHFLQFHPELTQESLNAYLTKRLGEVKKNTFNKIIFCLKTYAKFLKVDLEFPKAKKTDKRIKDYITIEELEDQVLPMFDLLFEDYKKYDLLVRFMFFTGLRIEEVIELEKDNIDFEKRIIQVKNTKGKVDREIFSIDKKMFEDLQIHVKHNVYKKVFDLTYRQINYALKKIEKGVNINKKIHPHFFRISFAKHCVRLRINDSIIQKLLGHADLTTTLLYCEPDRNMVHEACSQAERK